MTGARSSETRNLQWADVDFKDRNFSLTDTKNRVPVTLPLPDHISTLLRERSQTEGALFPPRFDPRKSIQRVIDGSGVEFSPHDLRRTFITIAESLDLSAYTIKSLVNHKMTGDVTAGYVIQTPERLKAPSSHIENTILRLAGVNTGSVLQLPLEVRHVNT